MICSPSGLQPYAHCLEHILREKNALWQLSVCKPSVAPNAPQHHTHKDPLNLDLFLWSHLTAPPPQTLQRSPTECLWCLQAAEGTSTAQKLTTGGAGEMDTWPYTHSRIPTYTTHSYWLCSITNTNSYTTSSLFILQ